MVPCAILKAKVTVFSKRDQRWVACNNIRPILEYCDTVWGCCGQTNTNALEALQRRAGRVVDRASSGEKTNYALKWPSLEYRRSKDTFNLVKRLIKGHCPQFFKNYFTFNNKLHSRNTRQKNLIQLPAVRTEVAKRSFY